jgi:hypothetical protein
MGLEAAAPASGLQAMPTRGMSESDQRALGVATDGYVAARSDYEHAVTASAAAYERLEASPDTLEYRIDWNLARRAEADAAWRLERAEAAYRKAGGYLAGPAD